MWDRDPEQLTYQNLGDQGKIVSLQTSSGDLDKINITWEDPSGSSVSSACNGGNSFPTISEYSCELGMIRVSIFPFTGDRASLIDSTYTVFFRPANSAVGGLAFFDKHVDGPSSQGLVINASCNGKTCKAPRIQALEVEHHPERPTNRFIELGMRHQASTSSLKPAFSTIWIV